MKTKHRPKIDRTTLYDGGSGVFQQGARARQMAAEIRKIIRKYGVQDMIKVRTETRWTWNQ